jgi:hypothetical protein
MTATFDKAAGTPACVEGESDADDGAVAPNRIGDLSGMTAQRARWKRYPDQVLPHADACRRRI